MPQSFVRPGEGASQLNAGLHEIGVGHSNKTLESFESFLLMKSVGFGSAFSPSMGVFEGADGSLDFLTDIVRDEGHVIDDLLFVMKSVEGGL